MKKVFVIHNTVNNNFGMPFVASSVGEAIEAVASTIAKQDWSVALATARLYCIGEFCSRTGELTRQKKKVVADASDLLNAAAKFSLDVVAELDESIRVLSQLKDFYTEVKNSGSCTQEG